MVLSKGCERRQFFYISDYGGVTLSIVPHNTSLSFSQGRIWYNNAHSEIECNVIPYKLDFEKGVGNKTPLGIMLLYRALLNLLDICVCCVQSIIKSA